VFSRDIAKKRKWTANEGGLRDPVHERSSPTKGKEQKKEVKRQGPVSERGPGVKLRRTSILT